MNNGSKIAFAHFYRLILGGLLFLCALNSKAQPDFRRACIQLNNSDVVLSWIRPIDPCNKFVSIQVYGRLNNLSPYTFIDSISQVNTQQYLHAGAANLGNTWQYFLVYKYLCNDAVFYSDTLFIDLTQPLETPIDSVSFDPVSQKYILGWKPNKAPDLMGYTVWETNGASNNVIANTADTFFTDNSSNPNASTKGYRISAFDSCINQSVISPAHSPSFLSYEANYCGNKIKLKWSPYIGQGIVTYSVYYQLNSDPFIIDTTLGPAANELNYDFVSGDQVEFFIRARLSNGASSRSNSVKLSVLDSFNVDSNYIKSVSWTLPNTLTISTVSNTGFFFDSMYLYRYKNDQTKLVLNDISKSNYTFVDNSIVDTQVYQYQQKIVDVCKRSYWSNISNNIVLKSTASSATVHSHQWNTYNEWANGVAYYDLEIAPEPAFSFTWNIAANGLNDTSTETDPSLSDTFNRRCYRVVAYEQGPSPAGSSSQSLSNPTCIIETPQIYFPNAINLSGVNKLFEPKGVSINKDRSKIRIYARNGQLLYDSDFNHFWDGVQDGTPLPTGVYIYIAEVHFLDGSKHSYKGNITLLH